MEILKDLECVEVTYDEDFSKVTLTFLDKDKGEVREVNYNKKKYSNGKWVKDETKEESVAKMIQEDLNCTFDTVDLCVGSRHDVYAYAKFNSLHPVDTVEKYTPEMKGKTYRTKIKEIVDGDFAIRIRFLIKDKLYESKMQHGKYVESMKTFFKDPIKEEAQRKKFKEKFGVPVEQSESLIDKDILVTVKMAFGKALYGEVMPLDEE